MRKTSYLNLMKFMGADLSLADLVPPVAPRIVRRLKRWGVVKGRVYDTPFDQLPSDAELKWMIDVGANQGDVTIKALRTYPECRVVAFEPVRATYARLQARLVEAGVGPGLGQADRVTLYPKALSDQPGRAEIHLTTFDGANSLSPQAPFHKHFNPQVREVGKETIELVRLDDIAAELPCDQVDLIKLDVEGHELNVIRGGRKFLAERTDMILVEVALMRDPSWEKQMVAELFAELSALGFRLINVFDLHRSTDPRMPLAQMDCLFRHRRFLKEV